MRDSADVYAMVKKHSDWINQVKKIQIKVKFEINKRKNRVLAFERILDFHIGIEKDEAQSKSKKIKGKK